MNCVHLIIPLCNLFAPECKLLPLAEYGWGEGVLLLEQGALGGGTTTHATGLVGILTS